ncbi:MULTISPECIES: DUF3180 domain-containing protein [unclassified Phycicoccus]|uniref:DUF3180 domain-containing protein n=1 Tax=unclassified Phycicoccus TaxID=2637926 RepID=UPI00138ED7AA|nr:MULTISPECIES: DUF3180 domain-containing protein [unclassified Phycicoccus]
MNEGLGLRWPQLVATAVVVGAVSWIGWRIYLGTGALLGPASWISSVLLVVMAVLVIGAGLPVRRFLRGEATKPLSPIRAARTLVLAQAAALTGSGVVGWYAAQVAHALAEISLPGYRELLWRLVALCLSAAVLAVAGMVTQRMCRVDPPDRGEDDA